MITLRIYFPKRNLTSFQVLKILDLIYREIHKHWSSESMDPCLGFSAAVLAFLLLHPFVSLFAEAEASVIDHTTQLQALLAIKSSINFDPKRTLDSWNDSSNLCQWSGVLCDDRGQVSTIDLSGRGLRGTVSPSIGNLSSLRFLYLQDNQFSGELPLQIGGLLHLEALNVSSVSIGGAIPPSITRCSKLTTLDLSWNRISGDIPADVDRLSELRVLNLSQNSFTGTIPPTIGNLSFLHGLNLGSNQLRGSIPSDLGRLHKLQVLHLSINHLTGEIPPTLYNLSYLTNFELASNNLHGEIPGDIGFRFPGLKILHVCFNKFTGRIPPSLHNVTGLRSLRLSNNIITGPVPPGIENLRDLEMYEMSFNQIVSYGIRGLDFITSLTNSTKLGRINFNENRLEGIVPESVGNLSKRLTKLNLGGNYISGSIPASMGLLTNLELLNISHNSISGEIPKELGRLKRLIELNLNDNMLSGEIPADLGNLSLLSLLELNGNQLAGSIPATLGKLKDLMTLDASNNKLQGSIPRELFTLSRPRTVLNLSHNALTGSLPKEIGSLENVETIDLSANLLAGSIPNSVGKCRSLQILSMSKNHFSGPIPETLGDVKGLQSLDLSVNQLSGPIPVSLAKIHALHFLNLSFNDLEGNVPTEGVFATAAANLQGNSKLCTSTFCESYGNRFSSRTLLVVILVATAVVLCLVGSIAFLVRRATTRAKIVAAPTLIKVQHPMISYQELHRATNGFDAGNLIGAGSFGSVYRGLLRDGAKVAVKVLKLETSRAMKSFSDECEALRNVRHRNLVKLVTVCMSLDFRGNDFRALVYELMGNGSLNEWIGEGRRRRGALSLVERLDVAIDVASALDYLHNYGKEPVVHRDVKPSNVLLDEEMTAKLGDFGLAKVLVEKAEGEESTTITHGLNGSIGYIPPEYGFGSKPSVKGDVYSYGVMLLELLTGKSPTDERFAGELSLVKWIRAAFPDELGKVLDVVLMGGAACVGCDGQQQISLEKKDECLASMIGIALSCVEESPDARLAMCDVLHQLKSIRDELMKKPHVL